MRGSVVSGAAAASNSYTFSILKPIADCATAHGKPGFWRKNRSFSSKRHVSECFTFDFSVFIIRIARRPALPNRHRERAVAQKGHRWISGTGTTRHPWANRAQLAIIEMDGDRGISQRRGWRHRQGRRIRGGEDARVGLGIGPWIGPGRVCGLAVRPYRRQAGPVAAALGHPAVVYGGAGGAGFQGRSVRRWRGAG